MTRVSVASTEPPGVSSSMSKRASPAASAASIAATTRLAEAGLMSVSKRTKRTDVPAAAAAAEKTTARKMLTRRDIRAEYTGGAQTGSRIRTGELAAVDTDVVNSEGDRPQPRMPRPNFSPKALATAGGTSPDTSPPRRATSRTRRLDT